MLRQEFSGAREDDLEPTSVPVVAQSPECQEPVLQRQSCALDEYENALLALMTDDEQQRRQEVVCDPTLARVAREKAADMARRAYYGHTDPDGHGPNYVVRQAGFVLPDWYGMEDGANNVESLAVGFTTPAAAWDLLANSTVHRDHVLGLSSFYADQVLVGVGHYYDAGSPYGHYWVLLAAPEPE